MFHASEIKSLNELELTVYNYIMRHQNEIQKLKIRELAKAAHVSTSTVLRFCKKMNCEGYSEFKIKFKMYQSQHRVQIRNSDTHLMIDYFHKVDTPSFDDKIEAAAKLITSKKKIIFLGIGTSGILGKYGARYFTNLGTFSQHIDDPFYPVPEDFYDDIAIIVLSVSGETEETIEHLNRFKSEKSVIVSITNDDVNTIAKMADLSLSYYMPQEIVENYINITPQAPVIFILEKLAQKVRFMNKNKSS